MLDYIMLENYAKDINVLFVEDDEDIIKETSELLELIFPENVAVARDGREGIEKFKSYKEKEGKYYDLVITDIQMPNINGIELSSFIYKENKEQLLIVMSAHSESHYLLELVNIGISHFVTKPLKYDAFLHVLYTKLKEYKEKNAINKNEQTPEIILNNELTWNREQKQMYLNKDIVKLTKKELLLLEILLKEKEQTHTIEEIINFIWADDENIAPDISNLKNIISRLRKKVPTLDIENIYGFGYRINII